MSKLTLVGASVLLAVCGSAFGQPTRNQAVFTIKTYDAVATIPTAKSFVPGMVFETGVRFTNFGEVGRTPNGQTWFVVASTDSTALGSAADQGLLSGQGLIGTLLAREGVTETTAPGAPVPEFVNFSSVPVVRMNNAGQWTVAYRRNVGGATAADDRLVRFQGPTLQVVLKPGDPIPGTASDTFGFGGTATNLSFNSANVGADGALSFLAYMPGSASPADTAFGSGGAVVVADPTTGLFIPTGQPAGASDPLTDIAPQTFSRNDAATRYAFQGIVGGVTVAVVDGDIKLRIGSPVPAAPAFLPGNVTNLDGVRMESSGDWFVWGRVGTTRFILRNGAVIAASGQPITPGSTELWGTLPFRDPSSDGAGNWVVGGTSNNSDTLRNEVLVYNSSKVIARESDPVDLNGDGVYNDAVFFREFRNRGTLARDDFFYISTTLKTDPAVTAGIGPSPNNSSLLRVRVCRADFNSDGATTIDDIFIFLNAWFAGDIRTDFNIGGSVNIDDIFIFLNDWFAAPNVGC
jgi:hypothetical protein